MVKRQISPSPSGPRKRREMSPSSATSAASSRSSSASMNSEEEVPQESATTSSTDSSQSSSGTSENSDSEEDTPVPKKRPTTLPISSATVANIDGEVTAPKTPVLIPVNIAKNNGLLTPNTPGFSHDGTPELPNSTNSMGLIPFQPADAFPVFKTGDVIIRAELGAEPVTFQLHSSVLIRHSPWFAKAFQFRPPKDHCSNWYLFKLENTGGKVSLVQHDTEGDRPILSHSTASQVVHGVEIKVEDVFENTANRISSTRTTPSTMTARNSSPPVRKVSPKAALACYTQVLGAFYSIPPPISTVNISTALVQAEELVKLAADLGCLHLLRPYLGHVLGEYRQKLFVAIKQDPPRWVRLALSLENKSIYTECLVHLIGAHPKWPWSTGRAALPEDLRRLVFNKAHEVEVARTEIERDLLLINLPYGRNATPPDPTQPGQTETWITVQIIRDQLALRIDSLDRSKEAALHRGKFFRQLRKGTLEVLDLENVRTICQGTMPSTWKDLRDDLKQLKEYVAELVEEIASNELMIDPDTNNIGYLTCAKVGNDDIPWIQTAGSSS